MTFYGRAYLDAGPLISLMAVDDRFHGEARQVLSEFTGGMMTSLAACLEAWVVLRRIEMVKNGLPPNSEMAIRIWEEMVGHLSEVSITVRPAPSNNPFDEEGVEEILHLLKASPTLKRAKDLASRARGVGVMDAVHLQAARSLGATHFLTTDRCLAAVDSDMQMILIGSYPDMGSLLFRPAYLDVGRLRAETGVVE